MLQSLLGRETLLWVVYEDTPEKIKKLLVERRSCRDDLLCNCLATACPGRGAITYVKAFHSPDILLRSLRRLGVRVIKLQTSSEKTRVC